MIGKDEIIKIKEEAIEDFFFYNGQKIAVLNNKLFKKVSEDVLIFVKMDLDEDGNELIKPIENDEYEKVFKVYKQLLKVINNKKEEN